MDLENLSVLVQSNQCIDNNKTIPVYCMAHPSTSVHYMASTSKLQRQNFYPRKQ